MANAVHITHRAGRLAAAHVTRAKRVAVCVLSLVMCAGVALADGAAGSDGASWFERTLASVTAATQVRLRYEFARDEALERDAHAVTLRMRPSLEARIHRHLSGLIELEGIVEANRAFANGVREGLGRPLIADAQTAELNRLQLRSDIIPRTQIVVGRQIVSLDDERFVGQVDFRQNDQTFDAVRVVTNPLGPVVFEMAYVWQVNRIFGRRSDLGRFTGHSALLNVSAPTPLGQVTAFHYALDLKTGAGTTRSAAASSLTTGVRLSGAREGQDFGVAWEGSYAHQQNFADNPIDGQADYILGGLSVRWDSVRIGLRYEVLGAGEQGFQAPLGTLHAFQGDADVFLETPPQGIQDLSLQTGWTVGDFGPFRGVRATGRVHRFRSDTGGDPLGRELDLSVHGLVGGTGLSLAYAAYRADGFASDQTRLWLSASRRF